MLKQDLYNLMIFSITWKTLELQLEQKSRMHLSLYVTLMSTAKTGGCTNKEGLQIDDLTSSLIKLASAYYGADQFRLK